MIYFKRIILILSALASSLNAGYELIMHNIEESSFIAPFKIEGTSLVLENIRNDSNEVAEVIIYNNCSQIIESFYLELETGESVLCFESTMIPPYGKIKLNERIGKKLTGSICNSKCNLAYIEDNGSVNDFGVLKRSDSVEISNHYNYAVSEMDLYVKERRGLYYLNRTLKMTIRDFKKGDSINIRIPFSEYEVIYIHLK